MSDDYEDLVNLIGQITDAENEKLESWSPMSGVYKGSAPEKEDEKDAGGNVVEVRSWTVPIKHIVHGHGNFRPGTLKIWSDGRYLLSHDFRSTRGHSYIGMSMSIYWQWDSGHQVEDLGRLEKIGYKMEKRGRLNAGTERDKKDRFKTYFEMFDDKTISLYYELDVSHG